MSVQVPLLIETCSAANFELVKKYITDFELDDRALIQEEFLTLSDSSQLLGFGRIREFSEFSELCSLGILQHQRAKKYGTFLCKALMQKTSKPLYLVCIIPKFFESLGFSICTQYPPEMLDKLNYCTQSLCVEESYVVMKRN